MHLSKYPKSILDFDILILFYKQRFISNNIKKTLHCIIHRSTEYKYFVVVIFYFATRNVFLSVTYLGNNYIINKHLKTVKKLDNYRLFTTLSTISKHVIILMCS